MKRTILIFCCLIFPVLSFAQEAYSNLEHDINDWMKRTHSEISYSSTKPAETIEFKDWGYTIKGYFKKGTLVDGSWVNITYDNNNAKIYGVAHQEGESTYIQGKREESSGVFTYGTFYISNTANNSLTNKVKSASDLEIYDRIILYHKGFYNECSAIVSIEPSCIAIDGISGERSFIGFYAPLTKSNITAIGYDNIVDLLLTVSKGCCIEWKEEHIFKGSIIPVLHKDGYIRFNKLEGEEFNPPIGPKKICIERKYPYVYMTLENQDNHDISKEQWIAEWSSIPSDSLWNTKYFYCHTEKVHFDYRNGDSYKGQCEVIINNNPDGRTFSVGSKITHGEYKYKSGDVFTGNLSGQYCIGVPIDGYMKFVDGTIANGNWIVQFDLTEDQYEILANYKSPSSIKQMAQKIEFSNTYTKYVHKDDNTLIFTNYFYPDENKALIRWTRSIMYNKKTGWYTCNLRDFPETKYLEFKTDNYGYHTEEIIYEISELVNSKVTSSPKYINIITWYPDHTIESIRTYHYNTKLLYLAINFFSDGSLKNAYLYDKGYNDKLVLRLSKESHPTIGGYTTKLYDFNGEYERTTSWKIGNSNLAPGRLDYSEIKPE